MNRSLASSIASFWQLIAVALLWLVTSCTETPFYEDNYAFESGSWHVGDTVRFEFGIDDTTARYDLFLHLRHTNDYPYANLWTLIETVFPDGEATGGRVDLPMAAPDGRWYGDGSGDLLRNEVLIQAGARLPQTGTYRLSIAPYMRVDTLPGLLDLGLIVRKSSAVPAR